MLVHARNHVTSDSAQLQSYSVFFKDMVNNQQKLYIYIYIKHDFLSNQFHYTYVRFYLYQGTALHQNIDEKAQYSDLPVIV